MCGIIHIPGGLSSPHTCRLESPRTHILAGVFLTNSDAFGLTLGMVPAMSAQYPSDTQLTARDLSVWRGGRLIFKNLNLELGAGESLVVTGPNGSGKSTLLRILTGLLRPETGVVAIEPENAASTRYSGHKVGLKGALTVVENLRFWAAMYDTTETNIQSVIDELSLHKVADMPADILSAGWKRRVGLGRMMLGEAPIWILDEPYTSLDTENVGRLDTVLTAHAERGGIVIMATHQEAVFAPTQQINMMDYQPLKVEMREDSW